MHEFKFFFFFFFNSEFQTKCSALGNRCATRNVVSLGRPKQNAQPGMFDGNHPVAG